MELNDKKKQIQMQYRRQIQLKSEMASHTAYAEFTNERKLIQDRYRESIQPRRVSRRHTIEVLIVAVTCIILLMGYLFVSMSEATRDRKIKQDVWNQLSYEQQAEVMGSGESAKVSTVIVTKDMMDRIQDSSYLNQEVYVVSYILQYSPILRDVYVEKKHNQVIGERLREAQKVILVKENSFLP